MIRPEAISEWITILAGTDDSDCACPDCQIARIAIAYIIKLETAIDGAVRELNNLYPNLETVRQLLRGEK